MQLSVEQLNGQTLWVEVVPDMTVKQVKKKIKSLSMWEDGVIREMIILELFLAGQRLKDDDTLVDLGLSTESSLSVIFRPNLVRCSGGGHFGLHVDHVDPEELVLVEVPESETEIQSRAFLACKRLAQVTIPDSVTCIREHAFCGCKDLRRVVIPDSVTQIGNRAFCGCSSLSSVTIPDSVSSIGYGAFSGCSSLTHVVIPNALTGIEGHTFSGCSSLTDLSIPDSVTAIGDYAFHGCWSLTSVIIPDSVTRMHRNPFSACGPWLRVAAPARLIHGRDDDFHKYVIVKECACGECKAKWFAKGWICPAHHVLWGFEQ